MEQEFQNKYIKYKIKYLGLKGTNKTSDKEHPDHANNGNQSSAVESENYKKMEENIDDINLNDYSEHLEHIKIGSEVKTLSFRLSYKSPTSFQSWQDVQANGIEQSIWSTHNVIYHLDDSFKLNLDQSIVPSTSNPDVVYHFSPSTFGKNVGWQSLFSLYPQLRTLDLSEANMKHIPNNFLTNHQITSVNFPTQLESIGENAFRACTGLTELSFPSSLKYIGNGAFRVCSGLMKLSFPSSLKCIGNGAFGGCSELSSIDLSKLANLYNINDSVFSECVKLTTVKLPNTLKSIHDYAFCHCEVLNDINLMELTELTTIGSYAFGQCTLFDSELPTNVKFIKHHAFEECGALGTKAGLKLNLEEYEIVGTRSNYHAFSGCSSLKLINLEGSSLKSIRHGMFKYCKLDTITFPISLVSIELKAFAYCEHLTYLNLSSLPNFTVIGEKAFRMCYILNEIILPPSLEKIYRKAFQQCIALESISFGENSNLTSIGDYAFSNCRKLNPLKLPSKLESIGENAFSDCQDLNKLELPSSLTSIGDYAFSNCRKLTELVVPSLTSIGEDAFYNCKKLSKLDVNYNIEDDSRNILDFLMNNTNDDGFEDGDGDGDDSVNYNNSKLHHQLKTITFHNLDNISDKNDKCILTKISDTTKFSICDDGENMIDFVFRRNPNSATTVPAYSKRIMKECASSCKNSFISSIIKLADMK